MKPPLVIPDSGVRACTDIGRTNFKGSPFFAIIAD